MTECKIPIVRADWFVSNATKPPLYHNILSIPETAGELEKKFGVDVYDNLEKNKVNRAGFQISGISKQNRLVERHDSPHGAYWKSYDFRPNNDFSLLTTYPLGPKYERNPYPKSAFVHDGGEIIFNLPNGLQAYMLVNGKDDRIDNGPNEVVEDRYSHSGTSRVSNGISCMGCHNRGMLPIKDIIRNGAGLPGVLGEKVRALYSKPEEMTEFIEKDEKLFLTALSKAVLPYVPEYAKDLAELKNMPEPITMLVMAHRDENMTLEHVAAELDYKDLNDLKSKINGNNKLKKLLPLCQPKGTIKRAEWEKVENPIEGSLFQICANALGKGKPYNKNE